MYSKCIAFEACYDTGVSVFPEIPHQWLSLKLCTHHGTQKLTLRELESASKAYGQSHGPIYTTVVYRYHKALQWLKIAIPAIQWLLVCGSSGKELASLPPTADNTVVGQNKCASDVPRLQQYRA